MQAFADDSGNIGDTRMLTLCGVFGEADEVTRFSTEWAAVLAEAPSVAYFKLGEFIHGSGEFGRLNRATREKKAIALAGVLRRHRMTGFGAATDLAAFKGTYALAKGSDASIPLFMPYQTVVASLAQGFWGLGVREPFEMTFDSNAVLEPIIRAFYAYIREPMRRTLEEAGALLPSDVLFRDDKQFMPLQAADMLAGLQRHVLDRHVSGQKELIGKPILKSIDDALGDMPFSTLAANGSRRLNQMWSAVQKADALLKQMSQADQDAIRNDPERLAIYVESLLEKFDESPGGPEIT